MSKKRLAGFRELFARSKTSYKFWAEKAILQFTEELCTLLEEKNISRAELARRTNCAPSYITRVLRGDTNVTVATMAKLATAVGAQVSLHLAPSEAIVRWTDEVKSTTMEYYLGTMTVTPSTSDQIHADTLTRSFPQITYADSRAKASSQIIHTQV